METLKKCARLSAVVFAAALSTTANAAFTVGSPSTTNGTGSLAFDGDSFDFSWSATPFSAEVTFTASQNFNLSLNSYNDLNNGGANNSSQVSGFFLQNVGTDNWLTSGDFCNSYLGGNGTGCDLIGESNSSNSSAIKAGNDLFSNLVAGEYRLGLYDSLNPKNGTAEIGISAVPLPAAAWMFLTAIAGFGFLANRKRKA